MYRRHFGFLRKFLVIFPALLSVLLITGCNPDTKEKKRISVDMGYIRTEIDKEIIQSNKILSELNDYKNKLSNLEDKKSLKEIEKAKCQHDFRKYVHDHPMTTFSLTTAGICAESVEVAAKIAWYANQLSNIDDDISSIDNRIYELKRKIGLLKEKHNDYEESLDALKANLKEKQERYNSL